MNNPYVLFWAALILGSIFWYGFLVFYVGAKAGREIRVMTKTLGAAKARDQVGK
ncbi:MAG: hypothetical protein HY736_24820 [Verrucomicrobia bacterium]|nr:hypothetical protein [Verrucomicrobiota bacterium]